LAADMAQLNRTPPTLQKLGVDTLRTTGRWRKRYFAKPAPNQTGIFHRFVNASKYVKPLCVSIFRVVSRCKRPPILAFQARNAEIAIEGAVTGTPQ